MPELSADTAALSEAQGSWVARCVEELLRGLLVLRSEIGAILVDIPEDLSERIHGVLVDANLKNVAASASDFISWLRQTNLEKLNSASHALHEICVHRQTPIALPALSAALILVDIASGITKPYDKSLKTSLFSLSVIAKHLGLNYRNAKLQHKRDLMALRLPLIANVNPEHYLVMTGCDRLGVRCLDMGRPKILQAEELLGQITGFVLAPDLAEQREIPFEYVPDEMAAFVWG